MSHRSSWPFDEYAVLVVPCLWNRQESISRRVEASIPGVERTEERYETQPADRFELSVGRDLHLGKGHKGKPLNDFVHPYAELDGRPYPTLTRTVSFETVSP
jgi:hypothetical protein